MSSMTKYLIIGGIVLIFIGTLIIGFIFTGGPSEKQIEKARDEVIKEPIRSIEGGIHLIKDRDEDKFKILYFENNDSFLISVVGSPFEEIRQRAEQEFLNRVGGDTEIACAMNVTITTPVWANEQFAGQIFRFSFCDENS